MPAKKTSAKKAAKKAAAKKAAPAADETADMSQTPILKKDTPPPPSKKVAKKSVASASFIKKQRAKLLELRDEIMESLHGVQRETIISATEGSDTGNGMHQGDAGSDSYDRDLALSMLAKEQDAIHEIEKALERIDSGTYGICEMSGEPIPQPRLEALPFARLTVECQQRWETEQRNRGVLPSDYGFGAFEANRSVSLDGSDD
ncbi:MAG: TraR/DksA family transcriptional regulator [Verrucomicrobiota bacterium JB023]|nr:TraR/DksA family transcriptional regulator [Verrucomicrobiota bacterium JB023]